MEQATFQHSPARPPGPAPVRMREAGLAAGAVAAGMALMGCPDPGTPADPYPDTTPPRLDPILQRLVDRCTFGSNAREATLAAELGYEGYLEHHLNPAAIDDTAVEQRVGTLSWVNRSAYDIYRELQDDNDTPIVQFVEAWVTRQAYSTRQLHERMVGFWTDHFNIFGGDRVGRALKVVDDREVIRAHAMGRFPDLLSASTRSPAMLYYLDNFKSRAAAPNQNYARELMELHTIGPDGFTQQDVIEVARCFTGWTIAGEEAGDDAGTFKWAPGIHDFGEKTVLGVRIPAGGGLSDGEGVARILTEGAGAPAAGRLLAHKLAVRFWGENPPDALVNACAQAYLDTAGDIPSMLRVVLGRRWLAQAPPKLKRPYHLVLSALRARPSQITDIETLVFVLGAMGQMPFAWPAPDGYPDSAEHWGDFVLARWSVGAWLVEQQDAVAYDLERLLDQPGGQAFMDELAATFFASRMEPATRSALQAFLAPDPDNRGRRRLAIGLALGSAQFQWA